MRLNTKIISVEPGRGGLIRAQLSETARNRSRSRAGTATGRTPNGDTLQLSATGVEMADDGYVVVDDHQQTTTPGIFALGDVCSRHQGLKHVANHKARVVQHNLLHPTEMIASDHRYVPQAVFSEPQVASVGLTEEAAREQGIEYRVRRAEYGDTAYGWAMEDAATSSRCSPTPGPTDRRRPSDRAAGVQLVQPLIQGMTFGTARVMARGQYWIHPAMAEVVENALLDLSLDS